MEGKFERNLFESKAFVLMLVFAFAGMAVLQLEVSAPLYLSPHSFALFFYLVRGYSFLLNPVLLFIAFYRICGRNIPEKTASTAISLAAGSIVGSLVGCFVAGGALSMSTDIQFLSALEIGLNQLQLGTVAEVLLALAAVAWAAVVKRWDEMLLGSGQEWKIQRPFEISVATAIYVLSGILTLCVLPVLFLSSFNMNLIDLSLIVGAVVLLIMSGIGQLIIGSGIYNGRRWGWAVGFVASLTGLALNVEVLFIYALAPATWDLITLIEVASATVSLFLNLIVMGLLLALNSRLYCRMVNPRASS
jgi:hypothetical protein